MAFVQYTWFSLVFTYAYVNVKANFRWHDPTGIMVTN